MAMTNLILTYHPAALHPIIFTDESTVYDNLNDGGIWREWRHNPPESFYIQDQVVPNQLMTIDYSKDKLKLQWQENHSSIRLEQAKN